MVSQEISVKNLHLIVNPAAGKKNGEAALAVMDAAMKDSGITSETFFTKEAGDGFRFAQAAVKKGVDAVAVYGGDGTLLEVGSGLIGSGIPLFILPGGSANVLANELRLPMDIKEATALLGQELEVRSIDAGQFNDKYFIVRAGIGFDADVVKGTDRETKNKVGRLAYFLSVISHLKKMQLAEYHITIDGKEYKGKGLTCIVTNAGNLGFTQISMDKNIDIGDGLLDILVVRQANFRLLRHFLATLLKGQRSEDWDLVAHWQGKDISILSNPAQNLECDGEVLGKVPFHVKVLPGAIQVLVPKLSKA